MTDFPHHTPRLLSEADADLAGLPRPTEAGQALPRAVSLPKPSFRLMWDDRLESYSVDTPFIDTTDCYTPDVVSTLVSERDALAGRVRELEAALRVSLEALRFDDLPLTQQNVDEWDRLRASAITSARAALSTTPESKP